MAKANLSMSISPRPEANLENIPDQPRSGTPVMPVKGRERFKPLPAFFMRSLFASDKSSDHPAQTNNAHPDFVTFDHKELQKDPSRQITPLLTNLRWRRM